MCYINSILSISYGKDRLDVFYHLDYFERIDSIPGLWGERRVSRAA